MERLGFGTGLYREVSIHDMIKYAELAEENGFDSFWFSETARQIRDAASSMSAFAISTKRIRLGSSIIVARIRGPALLAQTVATLDELSKGRIVLGLGAGVRSHVLDWNGFSFKKPLTALREYIDVVRQLLEGKEVNYKGEIVKVRGSRLAFKPYRPKVPIYIGATGTAGLKLAGEVADGAVLNLFTSPEYVKNALKHVRKGAQETGRGSSDFDVSAMIITSISDSSVEAKKAVKPLLCWYLGSEAAEPLVKMRIEVGEKLLQDPDLQRKVVEPVQKAMRKDNIVIAQKYIPDSLVETLTISGTPRECREKIQEYRKAGVGLPVLWPVVPAMVKRVAEALKPSS